ncbi:hypothetical protein THAOC_27472, partial [Thalassiosira oceanica]
PPSDADGGGTRREGGTGRRDREGDGDGTGAARRPLGGGAAPYIPLSACAPPTSKASALAAKTGGAEMEMRSTHVRFREGRAAAARSRSKRGEVRGSTLPGSLPPSADFHLLSDQGGRALLHLPPLPPNRLHCNRSHLKLCCEIVRRGGVMGGQRGVCILNQLVSIMVPMY